MYTFLNNLDQWFELSNSWKTINIDMVGILMGFGLVALIGYMITKYQEINAKIDAYERVMEMED